MRRLAAFALVLTGSFLCLTAVAATAPRLSLSDNEIRRFAPGEVPSLGAPASPRALTAAGATVSGQVLSSDGTPRAGAYVWWSVPVDGKLTTGSAVTDATGHYLVDVPPAQGTGTLLCYLGDPQAVSTPMAGRTRMTWAAGSTTTCDFDLRWCPVKLRREGPWPEWDSADLWMYGADGRSDLVAHSVVDSPYRQTDTDVAGTVSATAGLYDTTAVYWWANEGAEITTPRLVSPVATDVTSSDFVDSLHGWLSTTWREYPTYAERSAILTTEDGGRSWKITPLPQETGLSAIDFVDAQTGWACGTQGAVFSTQDGGGVWAAQDAGTTADLSGIAFTSAEHGAAVGASGLALVTVDGGDTWQPVDTGTTNDLLDVTFADDGLRGWAVGVQGTILATTDGGAHWVAQTSGTTSRLGSVGTRDGVHVGAVLDDGWSFGTLVTSDGGQVWTPGSNTSMGGAASSDIVFSGPTTAWIATTHGGVAKSLDGGAYCSLVRPLDPPLDQSDYQTVACAGSLVWVAGLDGDMSLSTDGGRHWSVDGVYAREAQAQRFSALSTLGASGSPGSTVKLRLTNYPKRAVTALTGQPEYPASAGAKSFGTYTSTGGANETKAVLLPSTVKPGYRYWFTARNKNGHLVLRVPFQVSSIKVNKTSVSSGQTVAVSGIVPTQGHWGSTPGRVKAVGVYRCVTSATGKFRYVKGGRTDRFGHFSVGGLKTGRTSWYTVVYAGDDEYWQDATSVVKVSVR